MIFATETSGRTGLVMIPEWVGPNKRDDCQAKSFDPQTARITVPNYVIRNKTDGQQRFTSPIL